MNIRYSRQIILLSCLLLTAHCTDPRPSAALSLAESVPTFHTIGDSTVALWRPDAYPKKGWGQDLQFFLDPSQVIVRDEAVSGSSAKSFYDSAWAQVKESIRPGDFVSIQFGINDSKGDPARHTDPFTTFKEYLTKFCNETQALGAYPILVTTVNRNSWRDGVIYPAYHDYPIATRQLASEINVPLIDLDRKEGELRTLMGEAYALRYLSMIAPAGQWPSYPNETNDSVHFQEAGALELDNLVIDSLQELGDATPMSILAEAVLPRYRVEIQNSTPAFGMVTRSQFLPAGVTLNLLAVPNADQTFLGWTGDITGTSLTLQTTMDAQPKVIKASFD